MGTELVLGVMSLVGTLVGTFGGILVSQRLVSYRLERLEQAVQEHNNFARRMPVLEEKMQTASQRIHDLEEKIERKEGDR